MRIRNATNQDREAIHQIHWSAFPESERESVSRLAVDLLAETSTPPVISLVAEVEGDAVGHVAFSPVTSADDQAFLGWLLSPVAVRPSHQKQAVGSQLIVYGMQQLSDADGEVALVYGDPEYYGRFGFSAEVAEPYVAPYELEYPFGWQGLLINERGTRQSPVSIACVPGLCDPTLW